MTIGRNTGRIQPLRNFSAVPLTFNHTRVSPAELGAYELLVKSKQNPELFEKSRLELAALIEL